MPSPLNIPKTFTTDDALRLKSELERLSQEIDLYLRGLTATNIPLSQLNSPMLAFDQVARVNVTDGSALVLKLPRPDPKNIGRKCGIRRSSTTGEVLIYAVGCLVGGAERYRMANDVHFVEFLFDGDYFPSRAGGGS